MLEGPFPSTSTSAYVKNLEDQFAKEHKFLEEKFVQIRREVHAVLHRLWFSHTVFLGSIPVEVPSRLRDHGWVRRNLKVQVELSIPNDWFRGGGWVRLEAWSRHLNAVTIGLKRATGFEVWPLVHFACTVTCPDATESSVLWKEVPVGP